jgi:hypothetical protein
MGFIVERKNRRLGGVYDIWSGDYESIMTGESGLSFYNTRH